MIRTGALVALIGILTFGLIGCGGGGSQEPGPPAQPEPDTSAIEGEVEIAADGAGQYELVLDGQSVPGALRDDGSYSIEGVPPGQHRVACVAADGMMGGYATVEVREGETARAERIVPDLGGQIVGMVTVRDETGIRPLEGVEVTAGPAVVIAADDDPATPDIYPPPDLPTFSAYTGADGSYAIKAVPRGEYVVTVVVPDMAENWRWVGVRPGRTAVADFRLRPAREPGIGTVQGRVMGPDNTGALRPLAGARVTITTGVRWEPVGPIETPPVPPPMDARESDGGGGSDSGDGEWPEMPDPDCIVPPDFDAVSTITNQEGEFSLNAPAGEGTIEVYKFGYAPVFEEIVIEAGASLSLHFELELWDVDLPPPPPDDEFPPGSDNGDEPPPPPDLEPEPDGPPAPPWGDEEKPGGEG